jgi:hypothetical protein
MSAGQVGPLDIRFTVAFYEPQHSLHEKKQRFCRCPRMLYPGNLWITFAFSSPILVLMFPGPESSKRVVVQCKGCCENIPAPVETMPSQPIAARCPLCHDHRRYLPSEVFLGRLSHLMIRKPVGTADRRVGR